MRHGKKINHLSRKAGHRRALLANMGSALIEHKRIQTTLAKAKALRVYLEPLVTKAKNNTTHSRRVVFSYLQDKNAVQELFDNIAGKVADRPGGYLRIVRTGFRQGDAADMALIEFVDYNETYVVDSKAKATGSKKKRTRRGGKKDSGAAEATETPKAEEPIAEAVVKETEAEVEELIAEVETEVEAAEEVVAEAEAEVAEELDKVEEVIAEAETEADEEKDEEASSEESEDDKTTA